MRLLKILVAVPGLSLVYGKGLWSSTPAAWGQVIREAYPLGNGKIGAMPFGVPGSDKVVVNIDSLWTGGPFESSSYTGGNPTSEVNHYLPSIRSNIFSQGTGDVNGLLGSDDNYGSFSVFGNFSVALGGVTSASSYNRSLDFTTGLHTTVYTANDGNTYTSTVYCTYPDQVCVYGVTSTNLLPTITVSIENNLRPKNLLTLSCGAGYVRITGNVQAGIGMKFDGIVRVIQPPASATCAGNNLVVPSSAKLSTLTVVFGAGTNYDWAYGNAASNFSFKGADPGAYVESVTTAAAAKSESDLRKAHVADYQPLAEAFALDLPDTAKSANLETSALISRYAGKGAGPGDPYLENTMFDLGRHMFICSGRQNSLPPNAAGRWNPALTGSWGDDYHADINEQMALWGAEQTGLGDLMVATMNYIEYTWVPRGTETAQLLYGAPGWVVHDEMNIFGHTAMKDQASWANYPIAPAWMMQHVYDRYSYSQNVTWYLAQGYPLMKGVAQFWLSQLEVDAYSKDNTLVVNPCNSPEHGPTTFGCVHWQQLIHQLFVSIVSSSSVLPASEADLLANITKTLPALDKGLHIGTWGEIKEWKLPDSKGYEVKNDTHRHLSHLIGWYPGWSMSSYLGGYTNPTTQAAVTTSLWSRGAGNVGDGKAGWEKVWRSACWATLNNTERAYFELRLAVGSNFAANAFSLYGQLAPPFQADANFGLVGATLRMLIVDLPTADGKEGRTVVLGPAIPSAWGGGSVKGMRLRGGGSVDFLWDMNGLVTNVTTTARTNSIKFVNKLGKLILQI